MGVFGRTECTKSSASPGTPSLQQQQQQKKQRQRGGGRGRRRKEQRGGDRLEEGNRHAQDQFQSEGAVRGGEVDQGGNLLRKPEPNLTYMHLSVKLILPQGLFLTIISPPVTKYNYHYL